MSNQSKAWDRAYWRRRSQGISGIVKGDELDKLRQHITFLHTQKGMTYDQIGQSAGGICDTTVQYLHLGYRHLTKGGPRTYLQYVRRTTAEALWAVRPETIIEPGRYGAHVPILPVQRRVQALVADGYPLAELARMVGNSNSDNMWDLANAKKRRDTTASTRNRIERLYDKLNGVRPEDMKLTPSQIAYARSVGRRNGWAPSHTWDPDTIDDPYAIPDWTGGPCGTVEGYRIHKRENIDLCVPCKEAKYRYDQERKTR